MMLILDAEQISYSLTLTYISLKLPQNGKSSARHQRRRCRLTLNAVTDYDIRALSYSVILWVNLFNNHFKKRIARVGINHENRTHLTLSSSPDSARMANQ